MKKIKAVPTQGGVWEQQLDALLGVLGLMIAIKKAKKK